LKDASLSPITSSIQMRVGLVGVFSMMLAADYEVMSRYAREDAERATSPSLKALYEAQARQWLELAAAAHRRPDAIAPTLRVPGFDHAA
jgi:hypothetical protein